MHLYLFVLAQTVFPKWACPVLNINRCTERNNPEFPWSPATEIGAAPPKTAPLARTPRNVSLHLARGEKTMEPCQTLATVQVPKYTEKLCTLGQLTQTGTTLTDFRCTFCPSMSQCGLGWPLRV
jgi:hypothetical protein